MRWLWTILLSLNVAHAMSGSDCSHKGVTTPAPGYPHSADPRYAVAFDDVHRVLCVNLKAPSRFFKGYRAHPGKPYKAAYLWDTAFISQIWMYWDTRIAQELLNYVMRFQEKNGRVRHAVLEILVLAHPYSNSQPPLLSWAAWRIYERSGDKAWLAEIYPRLKKYQDWLRSERRHPDGLYFWKHPYESGIDNSPRFANRDESFMDDTTKMAAVDMNSYIAMGLEALAKMARELGAKDEFSQERTELAAKINARLWDPIEGMYHDWDYRTNDFIRVHTVSDLTPMAAGIANPAQAAVMMNRIMDPQQYNTLIPFPSVARDQSVFIKDMWRGPVWINMAYLGVVGVKRYGYEEEARELAHKLIAGIYQTWENEGHIYEFYDPERTDIKELDRKKGNLWKKLTLGSKPVKDFVGWSGLVNTLVQEYP